MKTDFGSGLKEKPEKKSWKERQDFWVFLGGMVFIAILIGMIYGVGNAREWEAPSGFVHNETSSRYRFLPEPFIPEPGVRGRYGPGAVGRWYYWKLPPDQATFWTRFFPWVSYSCHQILIWGSIYYAQCKKAMEPLGRGRYSSKLEMFNWFALAANGFFHLLHFINTHTTYDGLAQDVSMSSSQGSVILIFLLVLLMEYKDRGIFFGWPRLTSSSRQCTKKAMLPMGPIHLIRKYHGYAFSWGAIYTFWYHPMENTVGHVLGFFYTWIILLQGSLMYTDFHLNVYWRLFNEAWVIAHGGVVAYQTGGPAMNSTTLWPMFVFGFGLVLVITQIFSLPFWKKVPGVVYVVPLVVYTAATLGAYSWIPDPEGRTWVRLPEIFRIPATYYMYFMIAFGLFYLYLNIEKRCKEKPYSIAATPAKRAAYLITSMLIYALMIGSAILVEYIDVQTSVVVLMIVFLTIFLLGGSVSFMLIKQAVPQKWPSSGYHGNQHVEPSPEHSASSELQDEVVEVGEKVVLAKDDTSARTQISVISTEEGSKYYSQHM